MLFRIGEIIFPATAYKDSSLFGNGTDRSTIQSRLTGGKKNTSSHIAIVTGTVDIRVWTGATVSEAEWVRGRRVSSPVVQQKCDETVKWSGDRFGKIWKKFGAPGLKKKRSAGGFCPPP
ncbi:hypothetical protein QTP88_015243 [Uroleucon formosanum]